MTRALLNLLRLVATGVLLGLASGAWAADTDVRVLIDVSGSMKKNDPGNLRVPAVRLLAGLMPAEARCGIWIFGGAAEVLVPVARADAAWKRSLEQAADRIHSRSAYTNIEAALEAAMRDWTDADPAAARSVLLLSDGMVDVAKNPEESSASRRRILEELLPRLQKIGARVHSVALSDGADHELLRALAAATDGLAERAQSAEELNRLFLRLFESAAPRDALPLVDNRFEVDAGVSELTLLVFRKPGSEPTRIVMPDGSVHASGKAAAAMRWHQEEGYDLITVYAPAAGSWQILADVDPGNRALIVTDLKLEMDELPANLLQGEEVTVGVRLTEGAQPITRPDFLALASAALGRVDAAGDVRSSPMTLEPEAGRFVGRQMADWPAGQYTLTVSVDGKTFKRERRHVLTLHGSPIAVDLQPDPATATDYRLELTATPELFDPQDFRLQALVTPPGGAAAPIALQATQANRWQATLPAGQPGDYTLVVEASGRSAQGRPFTMRTAATVFAGRAAAATGNVVDGALEPEELEAALEPAPEDAAHAGMPEWGRVLLHVGGANALLALAAIGAYVGWKRARPRKTEDLFS